MLELERKYAELILKKCVNFSSCKSLHIQCDLKTHLYFAELLKEIANNMGINDIYINVNDLYEIHDYLLTNNLDSIKMNPLFNRVSWNEYAKKGASLIFLNTSIPGLMDDIEPEKINKWIKLRETTIPYYRANVSKYMFPWTIAALPNETWAKKVFPNELDAYNKLYEYIFKMCMIDTKDPIKSWDEYIKKSNIYKDKLNKLKITKMHYKNGLGTDLYLEKPENNVWINLDKSDAHGNKVICNMPSYEIFTTPNKYKTNGIVYASKPLVCSGKVIENLSFEFKDGKITRVDAKSGKELIEQILNKNENARFLGEVALVPHSSPISNTGIVFYTTLFDENASCHLAFGDGYSKPIPNFNELNENKLDELGYNKSNVHTDFMIGTSDLSIEADTIEGKKLIFKKGNFNI